MLAMWLQQEFMSPGQMHMETHSIPTAEVAVPAVEVAALVVVLWALAVAAVVAAREAITMAIARPRLFLAAIYLLPLLIAPHHIAAAATTITRAMEYMLLITNPLLQSALHPMGPLQLAQIILVLLPLQLRLLHHRV